VLQHGCVRTMVVHSAAIYQFFENTYLVVCTLIFFSQLMHA
jgi:hypothetical protein